MKMKSVRRFNSAAPSSKSAPVTARKDDAAAADQAATAKVAVSVSAAWDGGLIQTTPG